MSQDIEQQAQQARWVGDVKVLLDNLNDLLRAPPRGIDVKVTAREFNTKVGLVAGPDDTNMVWKIEISASRTEQLI